MNGGLAAVAGLVTLAVASPSSAPASRPARVPIARLAELDGAYLEVVETAQGLRKTPRCGVDDQLILHAAADALHLRWSGSPSARAYPSPRLEHGVVTLVERRRTVQIERVDGDLLRLRYVRADGRQRSYLYARVERARDLPLVEVADEGCED